LENGTLLIRLVVNLPTPNGSCHDASVGELPKFSLNCTLSNASYSHNLSDVVGLISMSKK
jgi:hypothetical protein